MVLHSVQVHALVESDVAGELRGSHVRHAAIRRVSITEERANVPDKRVQQLL